MDRVSKINRLNKECLDEILNINLLQREILTVLESNVTIVDASRGRPQWFVALVIHILVDNEISVFLEDYVEVSW